MIKLVVVIIIIFLILALFFRARLKKLTFKVPNFFEGSIETHPGHSDSGVEGQGGKGGSATAIGQNSTAIGGKGGAGGPGSKGGNGGDSYAAGDNSFSLGGEGGEAGQGDRGGKGGRAPLHVLMEDYPEKAEEIMKNSGITEEMAKKYGKGGDGGSPGSIF